MTAPAIDARPSAPRGGSGMPAAGRHAKSSTTAPRFRRSLVSGVNVADDVNVSVTPRRSCCTGTVKVTWAASLVTAADATTRPSASTVNTGRLSDKGRPPLTRMSHAHATRRSNPSSRSEAVPPIHEKVPPSFCSTG